MNEFTMDQLAIMGTLALIALLQVQVLILVNRVDNLESRLNNDRE